MTLNHLDGRACQEVRFGVVGGKCQMYIAGSM